MGYEVLYKVCPDTGINAYLQEMTNTGWEIISVTSKIPATSDGNMSVTMRMEIEEDPKRYGVLFINQFVANYFDLDPIWLKTKGKDRDKARPRQIAQYIMHVFGHSNDTIRKFYNQDHSNISCSVKSVPVLMAENMFVSVSVKEIINKLKAPEPVRFKNHESTT